jgi:hypothetical protein
VARTAYPPQQTSTLPRHVDAGGGQCRVQQATPLVVADPGDQGGGAAVTSDRDRLVEALASGQRPQQSAELGFPGGW